MRRAARGAASVPPDTGASMSTGVSRGSARPGVSGGLAGRSARALRQLADGPRDADPLSFFRRGAQLMAETFGSRYAILARYADPGQQVLRMLAFWSGGGFAEPVQYPRAGTPCADCMNDGVLVIERGVQQRYPEDAALVAMGADSYIGVSLVGGDGRAFGVLNVIHDAPLPADDELLALLQLFAQRFAFELERQDYQSALSASEARFRDFATIAADWFWEQDTALRYSCLSPGQEAVTGWSAQRFLGRDRAAAFAGDVDAGHEWRLCLRAAAAQRPYELTYRLRRPDGQWLWIHERAQPLRDAESGEFLGFRGVGRDISAEHLLVSGWREQRDEPQPRLRERTRLAALGAQAAGAAHDLRNPLAAIRNAVHYLRRKAPGWLASGAPELPSGGLPAMASSAAPAGKLTEYLGIIDVELRHAEVMLTELLDVARPRPPRWSEFAVDQLCDELLERGLLPKSVALHYAAPRPLLLCADRALLRQLLANLLGNAAVAMRGSGEIRVAAGRDVNGQWLRVVDDGPGVAAAHRDRLFEPLFTTRSDGYGLGLWVARDIAWRHRGELLLEEGEGRGACFTLYLPPPPDVAPAAENNRRDSAHGSP